MSWKLSCLSSFPGNPGGRPIGCPNVPKSIPSTLVLSSIDSTHKFEQNKKKNYYNVYTSLKKIKENSL